MNIRKLSILICLSSFFLLGSTDSLFAQTVEAKVLSCTEKEISLELSSQATSHVGDTIDVGYMMGSMGESLIGTYRVSSFTNNVIGAEVIRSVIPASQDMKVVVYLSTEQPLIDNLFSQDYGKNAQAIDIGTIQKSLVALGYNPGEINSQFSKQTESAICAFQKNVGLLVDGKITQGLAERLYLELNSFDRFSKNENKNPSKKATTKNVAARPQSEQAQDKKEDFGDAFDDF
jgi:hypothetical protein